MYFLNFTNILKSLQNFAQLTEMQAGLKVKKGEERNFLHLGSHAVTDYEVINNLHLMFV